MWPARAMQRARERGRAEQDQTSPARPWSASWLDSFRVGPKPSRSASGAGAGGPVRYTRRVQRPRNRAADLCGHEHGSRRQLTWQAVCTRAARSRTRAGSEVCEAVSMPVGAVSATAGCRSRSSRAGRPVREVARSVARLCAVWPLYCVQVVIRLPPPASGGFVLLLVGGHYNNTSSPSHVEGLV